MKHSSGPVSHQLPAPTRSTHSSPEHRSAEHKPIADVGPDLLHRRTVVDIKPALSARIAENLAATAVRTSWYGTRRPAESSSRAGSKGKNTMARLKGKVAIRKGHIMAAKTKTVVARVYPKPGRLQEVIGVYAPIVPLVHQEPGCELFALRTDGQTVFVVEKWATPADLQAHAAGPAYAQIRAGISDLVEHAADVWVLDNLPFGEAAKGTIGSAPYAITNRLAQDTA
jgi:quinol monooxygenase YgiN